MTSAISFSLSILLMSAAVLGAVFSNRLSAAIRVPAPAIFLVIAAILAKFVPALHALPRSTGEGLVTVALIFILFDGGMHIGWRRFRKSLGAITLTGVVGTALTAAAIAAAAFLLFGFDLRLAL